MVKIIILSWNFVPRLIQIRSIPWWCSRFLFSTGKTFSGKFGPKNQNCQFGLKFRTRLMWICRIIRKIWGVHFFCFRPEKPFRANLVKKINIVSLTWILVPRLIWIMGNSMMMFTFSVFDHKYISWANLVQNFKIFSKWNLIQRLIRVCKIKWRCLFYVLDWK